MKQLTFILLLMSLHAESQNLTQYVNPFTGTGGHGHTFPGATLPFGFVQLSPDTRPDGYNDWDGCGGYHYSDSILYGFSHTHLSGTGVADYCDVLLMPTVGAPELTNIKNNDPKQGYASKFSHATEHASPGYYAVFLEDDSIPVELTATARVGFHKYKFPKSDQANIILDLTHRDQLLEGSYIEIVSPTKIQGLRRSSSWAKDQWLYFAIEFSQPFINSQIISGDISVKNQVPSIVSGTALKSFFQFKTDGKHPVYVKCALSPVSCAGAWNNMNTEIPGWDFEQVKQNANDIWNKELSKIEVTSSEDGKKSLMDPTNKLVIFYTALYHCMLAPNIYEDVDGKYRGRDNKIHVAEGFDYYTVFSLWDTYRAEHPLLTIIDQKRTGDFINTFLKQYEQGGRLPVWELSSNETDCMIGYHSVSVIADAAVKGIKGFDYNEAYDAMKHSANLDIYGLKYYKEKGFIESNEEPESVSKTLEYAYDDWCIAQMGKLLKKDDADEYLKRSANYFNLLDGFFMRPRINGGWYSPFDPREINFNYTEGNAWQYSFFIPQGIWDITGNAEIQKKYGSHLDSLFSTSTQTTGREQSDVTGLIGQYAHGNEPSHHIAYLYNYLGEPDKTAKIVSQIMNNFYVNSPDGLIGNEDCGQMSAWYVLSALGIYEMCPGLPYYAIGSPQFDRVIVHLENGKEFTVECENVSANNIFIQSGRLNDKTIKAAEISYDDILSGSTLQLIKNAKPQGQLKEPMTVPAKASGMNLMAPVIFPQNKSFTDSIEISISSPGNNIYYTIDGSDPGKQSKFAGSKFKLSVDSSLCLKAMVCSSEGICSGISTAHFYKLPHNYKLMYLTMYDPQYAAGGDAALIDGLRGGVDFRTGMWQGWQGTNMEVVLDLGEEKEITKAGAGFLQDVRSWIWMPTKVDIYISGDGKNFRLLTTIQNTIAGDNYDSKEIQNLKTGFSPVKTRYVKFIATQLGTVPDWHPGKGGQSWIFCDEVWVE